LRNEFSVEEFWEIDRIVDHFFLRPISSSRNPKFGKDVEKIPLGAVGIYTASQKIRTGLQQLMAGSRNFNLSTITRRDLMSLTEECEKVTGIPYVMRAYRKEADKILAQ